MGVAKFTTSATHDLRDFKTWLDVNKSTTFLKNFNIEIVPFGSSYTSGSVITISNDLSQLSLRFSIHSYIEFDVLTLNTYTGNYTYHVGSTSDGGKYVNLVGAILCNNGLILRISSWYSDHYVFAYICISLDSVGNLAVANYSGNTNIGGTYQGFRSASSASTDIYTVTFNTRYDSAMTSLCNIVIANNYNIMLPYLYVSMFNQLTTDGLYEVMIDGESYITSGLFYIKD